MADKKQKIGFFTYTCCEGCQFTMLFIDTILDLLANFDIAHFNLLKEKNHESSLDLAFVEGAITTSQEASELRDVRQRSKVLVAMGTCACCGGIPAMKNFVESKTLRRYEYQNKRHPDRIDATGLAAHVPVDYFMRGCPIIKDEFAEFVAAYQKGSLPDEYEGPVCSQCPRRGKNCFMKEKAECLGAITRGGCGAICTSDNIPCMMCRGPVENANVAREITMFEKFGIDEREIHNRLNMFMNVEENA